MRFLTKTMTKSFIASRRTSNHHEIDDTRKHQQKLNVPVREGKMRGSPFVPFFFARLLRAHNGKRVGQSRSIEQVRVFQTTKKKTEICNPKFNTMFFFLLLLTVHTKYQLGTYITYQQRLLRPRGLAFRGVLKENAVGRHFTRMTKFSSTLLSNAWTT